MKFDTVAEAKSSIFSDEELAQHPEMLFAYNDRFSAMVGDSAAR